MSEPTKSSEQWEVLGIADESDEFYVSWAFETAKNNIKTVNDTLQRLVILNTTLLGGSIVLLSEKVVPPAYRILAAICFLISLGLAFRGSAPYEGEGVPFLSPPLIRAHKQEALAWKKCWLASAAWFIIGGFAIAIIGLLVRCFVKGDGS